MKKITILLTAIITFTSLQATTNAGPKETDYLLTDEGIVYVQSIRYGLNHTLIAKVNQDEKIRVDETEVHAYRKGGKEYRKMMFVEEGTKFVTKTFLEKVYTRRGYTLYKRKNASKISINDYFIFSGDNFEMQLNKENYRTVLSFFFPIYNKLYMS